MTKKKLLLTVSCQLNKNEKYEDDNSSDLIENDGKNNEGSLINEENYDDINSQPYYIFRGFVIYDDYIYYFLENTDMLSEVRRYSIISENMDNNYSFGRYVLLVSAQPIIYKHKLYFPGFENDVIEYGVTSVKKSMPINKSTHKERYVASVQIRDDYFYYNSKFHISRDRIDGSSDSETIFENNNFIISYINVTDEYIFFVNRINDYKENKTDIQLYRMKHDYKSYIKKKSNIQT